MKEVMLGVPEEIELIDHRAMIELPEDSVEANIECRVFHDGELVTVTKKLNMSDLRKAFKKADDGYIDDDDRFMITDKGLEYLEGLNHTL